MVAEREMRSGARPGGARPARGWAWVRRAAVWGLLWIALGAGSAALAQEPAEPESPPRPGSGEPVPTPEPEAADTDTDDVSVTQARRPRETPRSAVLRFLEATRAGEYARAAEFLDLSQATPPADGPKLARHLKFVLDQKLWIQLDSLSDAPEGDRSDSRERLDRVGEIETPRGPVPIWMARSARDGDWRFAPRTVTQIEPLYELYGLGVLGEYLPPVMFASAGDLQLWQWVGLLMLAVLAYIVAAISTSILLSIARRIVARTDSALDDQLIQAGAGPLTALAMIGLFTAGSLVLRLSEPARDTLGGFAQFFSIIAVAWFAMRAVDVAAGALENKLAQRTDTTVLTIIPVGRRLSKFFLLLIAILAGLQNLGFNVISVIAGLGVIGIGVALAAQKTFENFFGTLSILIDQPIRRGNFCRFGDQVGTVEDIGLRSTRIRTLDRTLITLPNGDFSSIGIENFTARDQIRFVTVLGLRYETSADQLRHVLIGIKKLLVAHPRVAPDPARVRFVGFGAHSLDLEIFSYIETPVYDEFLAVREDLLLQIIDVVEASGTGFAFPSQTLYLARDGGLDSDRTRAAESQVRDWKEKRELMLPDPTPERLAELRRSLVYPPRGSALSKGGAHS